MAISNVATSGHMPTLPCPCWVVGFAQIRSFLGGGRGVGGDEGWTRQYICVEKHLTAANCLTVRPSPGLRPWTPSSKPSVPTLTSEPSY